MPVRALLYGSFVAVWLLAARAGSVWADAPADAVFLGGRIVTLDEQETVTEALAVRDGRVVAVGKDADVRPLMGNATRVIHLDGKMVLPGLIETHCHAIGVGQGELEQTYVELSSIGEIQDWIRQEARRLPAGEWIRVPRNEITRLMERRHPTRAELDAACNTHPVDYVSVRKHVFNSRGWEMIGEAEGKPTIPGGEIILGEDGRPWMVFGGDGHLQKFWPRRQFTPQETQDALTRVLHRYNEVGITSIFERASDRKGFDTFVALRESDRLTVRATLTFRSQLRTAADVERFVQELGLKPAQGDDWVRAGPLKITVDGGIHWGNTYLSEPYGPTRLKFYHLLNEQYQGDLMCTVEQMQEVFAAGHRLGWQMCCHVTGDGGTERVLDALEAVNADLPLADRRFNLIHAYFPRPSIVERCRRLGIGVDTQTYLYYKDSDTLAEVYGPQWAERFIGLGDWVQGGVPVAINADHMIGLDPDRAMNSFNPFLHLYIAVTRQNEQGHVHGASQKLSRLDALRCVTTSAAWLSGSEGRVGSLVPGRLADLVVIDRDYLACPDEEIRQIKPLITMVGGKLVFERK